MNSNTNMINNESDMKNYSIRHFWDDANTDETYEFVISDLNKFDADEIHDELLTIIRNNETLEQYCDRKEDEIHSYINKYGLHIFKKNEEAIAKAYYKIYESVLSVKSFRKKYLSTYLVEEIN